MNTELHTSEPVPVPTAEAHTLRREIPAFVGVLLLSVALQLVFLVGITILDSSLYSRWCRSIADGTYSLEQHLDCTRPLLIFPTALIFRAAGVSELTAAAYPMLCSAAILALTYLIGRRLYGSRVGLLATLLLGVCPIYVVTSAMLYPDVPLAFYMTLSAYLFLVGDSSSSRARWLLFFGAGLALGAAYLVKVTGVLLLIFYCVFFVVYRKKISKAHWLVFAAAALVFFLETGVYAWLTGDPLFRLHVFNRATGTAAEVGPRDYRFSFWSAPWNMFISINEFGWTFYLAAVGLAYGLVKKKAELAIPAIWFLSLYLYLHCGPKSLRGWTIGTLNCRYFIPVLIPGCLLGAFWLVNGLRERRRWLYHTILAAVVLSSFAFTCITYAMQLEFNNGPKAAWQWLEKNNNGALTVYSGVQPCRLMSFYAAGCPSYTGEFTPYYDYTRLTRVDLSKVSDCYVVLDELTIRDVARVKEELGPPPPEIQAPPAHWQVVASAKPGVPGLAGLALRVVDRILALPICPEQVLGRRIADIKGGLEGGRVTIYYVPSRGEHAGVSLVGEHSENRFGLPHSSP